VLLQPAAQTALALFGSPAPEARGLLNTVNRPVYRLEFLVPNQELGSIDAMPQPKKEQTVTVPTEVR